MEDKKTTTTVVPRDGSRIDAKKSSAVLSGDVLFTSTGEVDAESPMVLSGELLFHKNGVIDRLCSTAVKDGSVVLTRFTTKSKKRWCARCKVWICPSKFTEHTKSQKHQNVIG
jgi:hypothetical protein